eukprot:265370-Pleurochrysis_carterae.AAC.1
MTIPGAVRRPRAATTYSSTRRRAVQLASCTRAAWGVGSNSPLSLWTLRRYNRRRDGYQAYFLRALQLRPIFGLQEAHWQAARERLLPHGRVTRRV